MGVPRLFPFLRDRFVGSVKNFQPGEIVIHSDYLYLDANGLLHAAFQKVENYGENKRLIDPYKDYTVEEKQLKGFEVFFAMIEQIVEICAPRKVIFIAIDGSAPVAKQAQQRQRRFLGGRGRTGSNVTFDTSKITPGTQFMLELTKFMNTKLREKVNDQWSSLEVIFSPPTVPGEGEHKMLQYLRDLPAEIRTKALHTFMSPDADVILLALAAHVPHINLLRIDQYNTGFYHLLDISLIRDELPKVICAAQTANVNDVSNDFILLCNCVGDDFIPKIKAFYLLEDGIETMIDVYTKITHRGSRGTLTTFNTVKGLYEINIKLLCDFFKELSTREEKMIFEQRKIKILDPRFRDHTLKSHIREVNVAGTDETRSTFDFVNYRKNYYLRSLGNAEKNVGAVDDDEIDQLVIRYLETFVFIFNYYVNKLPSWTFFFDYYYPPLLMDISRVLCESRSRPIFTGGFDKSQPSLPFVQLLTVIPPSSSYLLPKPFHALYLDPQSVLVKNGTYDMNFEIDYEGKRREHEGVMKLKFADVGLIKEQYAKVAKTLKYRYVRNEFSHPHKFVYDKSHLVRYTSDYGDIDRLCVRKIIIE